MQGIQDSNGDTREYVCVDVTKKGQRWLQIDFK